MSAVLTVALVAAAMSVHAQELDVAGGYGYAAIRHEFDWKNYQGFWLGTSLYVRPWLGIVGEFDRLAWSQTYNQFASESHRRYGYLGGIKFTSRRDRTASAFVHALAGVANVGGTLVTGYETDLSSSFFAIQLGGGGDVHVSRTVSVRAGADLRFVDPQYSIAWQYPEWRLRAGVVYAFHP